MHGIHVNKNKKCIQLKNYTTHKRMFKGSLNIDNKKVKVISNLNIMINWPVQRCKEQERINP